MTRPYPRRQLLRTGAAALAGTALLPRTGRARGQDDEPSPPAMDPSATLLRRDDAGRLVFPDAFGVGGTQIASIFFETSDDQAHAMLQASWDAGVRYFDTSPWYGLGLSERRLGNFLDAKDPGEYVLSTKVGRVLHPALDVGEVSNWKGNIHFDHVYDYTAEGTRRSIEDSLQRLGVPKIDVVLIHDLAPSNKDLGDYRKHLEVAKKGAMPELTRMREEGVIGGWGMGVNDVEPSLAAIEAADPDVILQATEYSLVKHEDALRRLFPACRERNIGVIVGAPLNAGFLAGVDRWHYGGKLPSEYVEKRERLRSVAAEHDVDLRSAALQFTLAPDVVVATIPGARDAEQARANRASLDADIPSAFWEALRSEGLIAEDAPVPSGN